MPTARLYTGWLCTWGKGGTQTQQPGWGSWSNCYWWWLLWQQVGKTQTRPSSISVTYRVATLQFESYEKVSDSVFLEDISQDLHPAFPPTPCICLVVSKTTIDLDLSLLTSPYPYISAPRQERHDYFKFRQCCVECTHREDFLWTKEEWISYQNRSSNMGCRQPLTLNCQRANSALLNSTILVICSLSVAPAISPFSVTSYSNANLL